MGCTSICFVDNGHSVYATNYDYKNISEGNLFVNKKNVSKKSPFPNAKGEHHDWISKYGSVTFNLGALQFAWAGINEAGLVMSTMYLEETQTPEVDNRHAFEAGLWMQYLFDKCGSVEEVIASNKVISNNSTVDHHIVCDREGKCAVIEFLNGKTVIYTDKTLPIRLLTNNIYEESIKPRAQRRVWRFYQKIKPFSKASIYRFDIATKRLKNYQLNKVDSTVEYAFDTLEKASQNITQWSIVFDTANLEVHFRTKKNNGIRSFKLSSFDFSSATPVKMLNIHENLSGDTAEHFINYSHETVFHSYKKYMKKYYKMNKKGKIPSDDILDMHLRFLKSFAVDIPLNSDF